MDHLKPHPRSSSQPFKPLTSGSASYHSTYISPLKPLRASGASQSTVTESNSVPARRQSKQNTPVSSPAKR